MKSCQPIYLDTPASDVKKVSYIVKKQKDVKMLSAGLHGSIHDKQKQCLAGGSDSNAIVYAAGNMELPKKCVIPNNTTLAHLAPRYMADTLNPIYLLRIRKAGGASVDKLFRPRATCRVSLRQLRVWSNTRALRARVCSKNPLFELRSNPLRASREIHV